MVRSSKDDSFINLGPIWEESVLELGRLDKRFKHLRVIHHDRDIRVDTFIFFIHVLDDSGLPIHELNMKIPDLRQVHL
jgi:hypothetical protein